jgi:5-methylcytosine-specific restriction endonuclease McrA
MAELPRWGDTNRNRLVEFLVERNGAWCFICGATYNLAVHHLVPRGRAPEELVLEGGYTRDDIENLRLICQDCHDWVHSHPREAEGKGWLLSA